jgi:nitric oxide reductase large subunit
MVPPRSRHGHGSLHARTALASAVLVVVFAGVWPMGATAYTNHPPEPGCFIWQGCQQSVSPYPGEQVPCTPSSSNVAVSGTKTTTGGDEDSGNFCGTDSYIVPDGSGGWLQKNGYCGYDATGNVCGGG